MQIKMNVRIIVNSLRWSLTGILFLLCVGFLLARDNRTAKTNNLKEMLREAVTAQDHQAIAAVYTREAEEARVKAAKEQAMMSSYSRWVQINKTWIRIKDPDHCKRLVNSYLAQAARLDALAKAEEEIASPTEEKLAR